ncbi:hypothetical protein FH972_024106 [Carpinus fangiana]|uniref:Aminoglycoside phosphotransferase domain-containing protein n=1 Tax=Carpinus fangiana TaxID=176857 RepID=A0A5N6KX24_9ROSI|nr:hypothetical protein FH972_024106 [Carpinus fangiana]
MDLSEINKVFTQDAVIKLCANPPEDQILSELPYSNRVVRIANSVVVKFGYYVKRNEAENQKRARELVDLTIVYIPKVYGFFQDADNVGYIVMEFVEGSLASSMEDDAQIDWLVNVVHHISTLPGTLPGPVGGGPATAVVFGDSNAPEFEDIIDLTDWFNARLIPDQKPLSCANSDLVLCHLDIAPQNVIWRLNQAPCLIDWASAGFYPRTFERCSQELLGGHLRFRTRFVAALTETMHYSTEETEHMQTVLAAWSNCQRYSL